MTNPDDGEPILDTPAGLLGAAAELLTLCDELLHHPGHSTLDAEVHTLLRRHDPDPATAHDRLRALLPTTAAALHHILHEQHTIIEPMITRRRIPPRTP